MAAEGWGGKEICTKGMVDGQKKGVRWGWGNEDYACPKSLSFCKTPFRDAQVIKGIMGCFAFPFEQASSHSSPAPNPTVHSNSKSNMAGRINDCELLTLARTNKTPALQASLILKS